MKPQSLIILCLIFAAGLFVFVPAVHEAHASVGLVQGPYESNCTAGAVTSCTITYQNPVTAGNLAALTFWVHNVATITVTDIDSANFNVTCAVGSIWQNCVAVGKILHNHAGTVYMVTVNNGGAAALMNVAAFEVSGGVVGCTATGTGASGTAATTSTSCSFSGSWFILASSSNNNANGMTLGANFSDCDDAAWVFGIACEYDTSSVASPSNFPFSWTGSSAWQVAGMAIVVPGPVTITVKTSPVNLLNGLIINGTTYSTTQTFLLNPGRPLNLTAATKVLGPGATLYSFSSWSDSGARSHVITVPSSNTTYIATFSASGGPGGTCPGTPFQELQEGCWLPAIVNWYSNGSSGLNGGIGLSYFLAIVIGDIDIALFLSTRSGLIAGTVFTVSVAILGFALPGVFPSLAYFTLIVMPAAVIYKAYTLRS